MLRSHLAYVFRENNWRRIALGGQRLGHVLIRKNPAVIVVALHEKVTIADLHPHTQNLRRSVRDQGLMEVGHC